MRRLLASLLVAAVVAPLAGAAPGPAGAQALQRYLDPVFSQVTVTRDLAFGSAPDFGGKGTQVLRLDLYQPAGDTLARRPVLVLAFGGGFTFGTKEQLAGLATDYAERGFVVASITYRLDEEAGALRYPVDGAGLARILAAKDDMQASVRWLRSQAVTYGLDPGKVSVGGVSAGAITALMTALMPDAPGSSGTPGLSSSVCTAVSVAGGGGGLAGPGDAGAIFFHGDADPIVPYVLGQATEQAMRRAGLPTRFVTYAGGGHDILQTRTADIVERSSAWLDEQMVRRSSSCAGPVDPAAGSFVTAAHHDFLGRAPSATELAEGVSWLDSGGTRATVLSRLTGSDEWLGAIVTGFYTETLGRGPDGPGLAFWVDALRRGRWTVAQVASMFYAADEYYERSGDADGPWVADLYRSILGRSPDAGGLGYWTGQVALEGRTSVATRFHGSPESRRDRVTALYDHLLGRAPEADGLAYWADRIVRDGDLSLARNLAASAEYRTRAVARYP